MKTKMVALAGLMLGLFSLSSCVEMESEISVKKDGSGTITENLVLGAQMVSMMEMGAQQAEEGEGESPFADFEEEALREKASSYGEGVELASSKQEKKDGKLHVTAVYKFDDVTKLTYAPGKSMNDEEPKEEEMMTFAMEDDVLTVMVPDPAESDMAMGDDDMSEEQMAQMAPMLAGAKMSSKLVIDGGIAESNATFQDGDSITLMSINFDELLKNEEGMKAMKKLDGETREEVAKAVKEINGVEFETQEKVTVKFE
jgi:hypothetical protein